MISPKLRLALVGIFFIFGIIAPFAQLGYYLTFAFIGTALILLMGHFRHGPILSILGALRRGKLQQAETLVHSIKRPEWLSPRFKAYYHFANSLLAANRQDAISSKEEAEIALGSGHLHENEQAILRYNWARSSYEQQDWTDCRIQLELLQQLSVKDLHLKKRIEELTKAVHTKG